MVGCIALLSFVNKSKETSILSVGNIILCASQLIVNDLVMPLEQLSMKVYVVGGTYFAGKLDVKRAIRQGTKLQQ